MKQIIAVDNEYVTLWCDPGAGIIGHVMHRFVVSRVFRESLETGLALLVKHGATKWLSDERKNGPLSQADSGWIATDWSPRAIEAGFRSWAMLLPESVFGQMKTRRMLSAARRAGITVEAFTDPQEAIAWLESLPVAPRSASAVPPTGRRATSARRSR